MNQDEWEEKIIKYMVESGWINDRNEEKYIGFSRVEGDHHWIRDYDNDGNQRVNLV